MKHKSPNTPNNKPQPGVRHARIFVAGLTTLGSLAGIVLGSGLAHANPRPVCDVSPVPGCEQPILGAPDWIVITPDPARGSLFPVVAPNPPREIDGLPPCTTGACG
jgi:hypothetical protein